MPVRTRAILAAAGFVVLVLLWFLFLLRPTLNRISELKEQQSQQRNEQAQLRTQIQQLQGLQERASQLQADLARFQEAVPGDPRLPDFILQVQESASLAGIEFLSISPSLPAPFTPPAGAAAAPGAAGQLQAITVSVTTTGRYFEILDFIVRMERLRRAVRLNNFSLAPGGQAAPGAQPAAPGSSPTLSVNFSMQMFVVAPAAGAGGGAVAPPPTPTPSPAPGASPTPTPGPGATPTPSPRPAG